MYDPQSFSVQCFPVFSSAALVSVDKCTISGVESRAWHVYPPSTSGTGPQVRVVCILYMFWQDHCVHVKYIHNRKCFNTLGNKVLPKEQIHLAI